MRKAVVCAALLLLCGCDDVRSSQLEQQLREDPGRPGKVGSVVGIAVYQRAARLARRIASAPVASCDLSVEPGSTWTAEIEIERLRLHEVVASWEETRAFRRTTAGAEVRSRAKYRTMIDQEGERQRHWRRIGDAVWVSTEAAGGPLWYRRAAEEAEDQRQLDASVGTFQALLDAVDGWEPSGAGTWGPGDSRLRCVRADEGLAFVDRFVVRATLRNASLRATPSRRELKAEWDLDDGSRLRVTYQDEITTTPGDLDPPPDDRIVPIERDRSLARVRKLADDLAEAGIVKLTSPDREQENTGD